MRYLLFDLDGTLLNTRDGIVYSISYALEQEGICIKDYSLLERHIGPPIKEGFKKYYGFSDEKADEVVSVYRGYYAKIWRESTRRYDGIVECLEGLRQKGFQLIVATSKLERFARQFLSYFELDKYFIDICGSSEDQSRAKKADVISYALRKNEIEKNSFVYMIGDRSFDVLGAKEEGIPCVGVLYGFGSREELEEAGATDIVKSTAELLEYFINM